MCSLFKKVRTFSTQETNILKINYLPAACHETTNISKGTKNYA